MASSVDKDLRSNVIDVAGVCGIWTETEQREDASSSESGVSAAGESKGPKEGMFEEQRDQLLGLWLRRRVEREAKG